MKSSRGFLVFQLLIYLLAEYFHKKINVMLRKLFIESENDFDVTKFRIGTQVDAKSEIVYLYSDAAHNNISPVETQHTLA